MATKRRARNTKNANKTVFAICNASPATDVKAKLTTTSTIKRSAIIEKRMLMPLLFESSV
jgi:hypothetical protein